VDCYEPICELDKADAELSVRVSEYHKALDCYFAQDWDGAESIFMALQQSEPDTKLYKVYIKRIGILRGQDLDEDWGGSFTHASKKRNSDTFRACLSLRAPSLLTCRSKSVKCGSLCAMGD